MNSKDLIMFKSQFKTLTFRVQVCSRFALSGKNGHNDIVFASRVGLSMMILLRAGDFTSCCDGLGV
jgi:hypothetical protein